MKTRPITESPVSRHTKTMADAYTMPKKVCATCGKSSTNSWHHLCKRDERGQLLVKEGKG